MKRAAYFFAGALGGAAGGFFLGKQKSSIQENDPPIIKIPYQSNSGKPIAIFELPDEVFDETRYPAKDEITPPEAKQGIRTDQAKVGNKINAWNSTIPPSAYLKLHRHPVPRLLFSWSDGVLHRQQQDKRDVLPLKKNTFMVFASDPKDQFHNDYNPSSKDTIEVSVIEVTPPPKNNSF